MESCVWTPQVKGRPSKLFTDLMKMVENRDRVIELYSLALNPKVKETLGLDKRDENGEPLAEQLISTLDRPELFLGKVGYMNYIIEKEHLNRPIEGYEDTYRKFNRLVSEYPDYAFSISGDRSGYSISVSPIESGQEQMIKSIKEWKMYVDILDFLHANGLDIVEGDTFVDSSRFSPKEAEKNSRNLLDIIRIAKRDGGLQNLPEEFSHLIIEGLKENPLVQRLMNFMDDAVVKAVLGDSYDTYRERYSSDEYRSSVDELLRKEAAGQILGMVFNAEYTGTPVDDIAARILNLAVNKFKGMSENRLKGIIDGAVEAAESLVQEFQQGKIDTISLPDILSAETLHHLDSEVTEFQRLAERAYDTLVKKMKIFSSRRKTRGFDTSETNAVKQMAKERNKKEYAASCFTFLKYVLGDFNRMFNRIDEYNEMIQKGKDLGVMKLRGLFRLLKNISNSITAYQDVINAMTALDNFEGIEDELKSDDIQNIISMASQVNELIQSINYVYGNVREEALKTLIHYYWGESKEITLLDGTKKTITAEDLLNTASSDISWMSRMFNSMEDASDPLLAVMDSIYKSNMDIRDKQIFALVSEINSVHKEYVEKTGSRDTSFMYVFDENGVPTGMIKSDRDFSKYWKDREEYVNSLKEKGLKPEEISAKLMVWTHNHTELVPVSEENKEEMPRRNLYPSRDLESLTKEQREYYDKMMALKRRLDTLLPQRRTRLFKAPQKRASFGDAALSSVKNGTALNKVKQGIGAVKQVFSRTEDDTEFGGSETEGDSFETMIDPITGEVIDSSKQRRVLVDFGGNPVTRVPTAYMSRLEDMSYLSLDFTDSLSAYAAMAVNYNQMDKIADAFEVLKDFIADRKTVQRAGTQMLYERLNIGGKSKDRPLLKEGRNTQAYEAVQNYIDRNIYGRSKKEEVIYVGGRRINYGKGLDAAKAYSTMVSMGYNPFSSVSNITMGTVQLFLEAVGNQVSKEGFRLKDLIKGIYYYFKNIHQCISGVFNDVQEKKLPLLMQKFNILEDYYRDVNNGNSSRNAVKRMTDWVSPLKGQNIGEHFLHGTLLCAQLNSVKVKVPGKAEPVSLLDAFEVVEVKTPSGTTTYDLKLPDGTTTEDGQKVNAPFLRKVKMEALKSSHNVNGAYGDVDKGQASHTVLGRLIMQYRQWMPAFVMNRFKTKRYSDITEREEEGFYLTAGKFLYQTIGDLMKLKFTVATRWNKLSPYQRGNIAKAITEAGLFWTLSIILAHCGKPDDDDSAFVNFMRMTGYRLKLELGSAYPLNLDFGKNVVTLFRSPVPTMQNVDYLINLLAVWDLGDTIDSGKYEGWNRYLRNLYYAVPYARNIGKVRDLQEGNFEMFNPYLKIQ